MRPRLWMNPGMIPILHRPGDCALLDIRPTALGVEEPGAHNDAGAVGPDEAIGCQHEVRRQSRGGTADRVLSWVLSILTTRTMSFWGMPSVMHTTRGISAAIASSIDWAATAGGTKIPL